MEKERQPDLLQLSEGEGSIGSEHTPEVVQRAEMIVQGEYHRATDKTVVCKCIDGRNCADGLEGPNSAGGSLSLLVADDLTTRRFVSASEPISVGMGRLSEVLQEQTVPIGVHCDTHASGEASGCGANDKLPLIYAMIVKKAEHIRMLSEMILGISIPQSTHDMIMLQATERAVFGAGKETFDVVVNTAGSTSAETLEGAHNEIVAVINLVHGTTLDRDSLSKDSSNGEQAFNVDAWAFEESARVVSKDDSEIQDKVIALTYYNLATALVLCGPNMLVGIRK